MMHPAPTQTNRKPKKVSRGKLSQRRYSSYSVAARAVVAHRLGIEVQWAGLEMLDGCALGGGISMVHLRSDTAQLMAVHCAGYLQDRRRGSSSKKARTENAPDLERLRMEKPTWSELLAAMRLAHRTLAASQEKITRVAELLAREGELSEDAICRAIRGTQPHEHVCVLPGATSYSRPQQAACAYTIPQNLTFLIPPS
ncbi:hypothetical protein ACMHYB_06720 [Sorangium sp. So ce1128]